jgi:NSS family neurotransmitter:Na+ symporter
MNQGVTLWGWIALILGWGSIIGLSFYCFSRVLFGKKRKFQAAVAGPGAERDRWASRIGLVLAMAGNAIGLGNFLRFPVKAAQNGGGAFLIPYFCALIFMGIPMMWVEWTIGRHGGAYGHSSTPGMFQVMWKHPIAKYVGAFGIFLPFSIGIYYLFIMSWTLGYSFFSATSKYFGITSSESMRAFLKGFQGVESNQYFSNALPVLVFLGVCLALNYLFLSRGIAKGIELLAKYGMPLLFLFGIALAVRALTLGTPDPSHPDWNIANGMGFIWNPDLSQLGRAQVWLVAAGQIFFTLSLGQGMIHTYASYVREQDDITLNGLATSSVNEFAEVILGGTIAIPVAVAFFGLAQTRVIAGGGAFDLGFVSLPLIFQRIPVGQLFGFMWFGLLFIAGITTSVAFLQPIVAFVMDEFKMDRKAAVNTLFGWIMAAILFVFFFFKYGVLDELDFWAGTIGIVLFGVLEVIIFGWIFGVKRGWQEMHKGADFKVPKFFRFVFKFITPAYILVILVVWIVQDAVGTFLMRKGKLVSFATDEMEAASHPYRWAARVLFLLIIIAVVTMVRAAWKRKAEAKTP